jgi:hypothetical protein
MCISALVLFMRIRGGILVFVFPRSSVLVKKMQVSSGILTLFKKKSPVNSLLLHYR